MLEFLPPKASASDRHVHSALLVEHSKAEHVADAAKFKGNAHKQLHTTEPKGTLEPDKNFKINVKALARG